MLNFKIVPVRNKTKDHPVDHQQPVVVLMTHNSEVFSHDSRCWIEAGVCI